MNPSHQPQSDPEACGLNNRGNPPGRRESTAGFGTALPPPVCPLPTEPLGDERSVGGVEGAPLAKRAGERSSRSGAGTRAKHGAAPHDVLSAVPNPSESKSAAAGVSSLDTTDITDPTRPGAGPREAWLRDLERRTELHRYRRARDHEERAREKERLARKRRRDKGLSELNGQPSREGEWHRARARGQRERFKRALRCSVDDYDFISIDCAECGGNLQKKRDGCGCALACPHCRGVLAYRKRAKLATARDVVLERAKRQGLLSASRPGGRWSEKLLTLTMPHLSADEDDASDERVINWRIRSVLEAWRAFARTMNKWLARERNGCLRMTARQFRAAWFRALEWTPAVD